MTPSRDQCPRFGGRRAVGRGRGRFRVDCWALGIGDIHPVASRPGAQFDDLRVTDHTVNLEIVQSDRRAPNDAFPAREPNDVEEVLSR